MRERALAVSVHFPLALLPILSTANANPMRTPPLENKAMPLQAGSEPVTDFATLVDSLSNEGTAAQLSTPLHVPPPPTGETKPTLKGKGTDRSEKKEDRPRPLNQQSLEIASLPTDPAGKTEAQALPIAIGWPALTAPLEESHTHTEPFSAETATYELQAVAGSEAGPLQASVAQVVAEPREPESKPASAAPSNSTLAEFAPAPVQVPAASLRNNSARLSAPAKLKSAPAAEPLDALKVGEESPDQNRLISAIAIEAKLTPHQTGATGEFSVQATPPHAEAKPAVTEPAAVPKLEGSQNAEALVQQRKPIGQEHPMEVTQQVRPEALGQPQTKNPEPAVAVATPHLAQAGEPAKPAPKPIADAVPLPELKEAAQPRTEPVRDISFRIGSADANPVDVQLTDRAGQIHVSVRSADPALARSLQDNVTELAGKLERSGFHTETQIPNRSQSQSNPNFEQPPRDRRSPFYDAQRPKRQSRSGASTFEINMPQSNIKDTL